MKTCDNCGRRSGACMEIVEEGRSYFFDRIECAIEALEPICQKCKRHIVGRPLDVGRKTQYCDDCLTSNETFAEVYNPLANNIYR